MKGIFFTPEMVTAILEGRKTQTRRLTQNPRFYVGETVYVKEAWAFDIPVGAVSYRAARVFRYGEDAESSPRRRNPMFMPERASRIKLEITAVRRERLHDISEQDAIAEGIKKWDEFRYSPPRGMNLANEFSFDAQFYQIWESIHGEGSWDLNPLVWVYTFKMVQP